MRNIFVSLYILMLLGCGNRSTSNDAVTEYSVKSETICTDMENTPLKLIVNPLPALNEETLFDYGYEAAFILFDTIIFTHKNITYRIYLERFEKVESCPGDFHLMTIDCNGEKNVFFNPDGWRARYTYDDTSVPNTMLDNESRHKALDVYRLDELKETVKNNLIDKRYIAITELSSKDIVLIAWGFPYGTGAQLTIFNLTRFEKPTLIYNDLKELTDIADYDQDGTLDIGVSGFFRYELVDKNGVVIKNDKVEKYLLKDGWFEKLTQPTNDNK